MNLNAMRDLGQVDPLPRALGEKVERPAPAPVKPKGPPPASNPRFVTGPDGKLETNIPENREVAKLVVRKAFAWQELGEDYWKSLCEISNTVDLFFQKEDLSEIERRAFEWASPTGRLSIDAQSKKTVRGAMLKAFYTGGKSVYYRNGFISSQVCHRSICPYKEGSEAATEWLEGWDDARRVNES